MKKKEFLKELEERLIGISKEDKKEILQDYEEHFKVGKKKKRTEEEISKSLGDPKEIAKEIRKELSGKKDSDELKTEAIETWVVVKRFSKHIFNEVKEKSEELYEQFDSKKISHWILLFLGIILFFSFISIIGSGFFFFLIVVVLIFFIFDSLENKKKFFKGKKKTKRINKKKSPLKTALLLLFNILIFIWIWIALFFAVIGFFVVGVAMIVSGILSISFAIFSLITYSSELLKDILFSALFAGFGMTIFGILIISLFDKVSQLFFEYTKKYLKLNQEWMNK
ncbi:MAG: DUF1700 domain-containing protein [Candidatus Pacearchaeota archaeon]|nr:DUF1700 domain-containing protein [Candidatus Pacearchaeota archaeon]